MFLGIDFGTTTSQASTVNFDRTFPLLKPGVYGIDSMFYYDSVQGELVGKEATDAGQGRDAVNLVKEVKMDLDKTFTLDGKTFKSGEIVKAIYKAVIDQAREVASNNCIDPTIEGVVLSHPAKFNVQECDLIRSASAICMGDGQKLNITGMIKEPVAAALSYYHLNPLAHGTPILVYDLGGGTCDIAIVESDANSKKRFEVIDSTMVRVGGRDWDSALIDYAVEKIEEASSGTVDIRGNAGYMEKIRRAAVDAKHTLSNSAYARMRVEIASEPYAIMITREQFDELTVDLLEKTLNALEDLYNANPQKSGSIAEIICVGGSSNMPQVRDGIQARFPNCTVKISQPEYAIVNGAAIYSSLIGATPVQESVAPSPVQDFLPFSYGVRCLRTSQAQEEFVIQNILLKGTKYPANIESDKFKISGCGNSVVIEVYESECGEDIYPCNAGKNEKSIGNIIFQMPSGAKPNDKVYCTLSTNDMSEIQVKARNDKGEKVEAVFTISSMHK